MYHHPNHNCNNISSRTSYPSEKNLFLQAGNGPGGSGLVLSTDAKPRLKWTHELHERFVEATNQLGGAEKATPKTVMRLMGVPGLTLYHLKSHLQKYRLSKNLQVQPTAGISKSVTVPPAATDRTSEGSGSTVNNVNVGSHGNKTTQINEALQMQMEVQQRLHEQLEVQRNLQRQIEAQGKYLQSVLEKAQETLGKQNLGSAGLEGAKMQISELVSKVSNKCFASAFIGSEETHGLHNLQGHATQFADCSLDSCLTSSEGSQKDQEMHNTNMTLGIYHGNLSQRTQKMQDSARLEQIQSGWYEDLNDHKRFRQSGVNDPTMHEALPVSRGSSILSMSITNQTDATEVSTIYETHRKQNDEHNFYIKQPGYTRGVIQRESSRNSNEFELPCATVQLDLNAYDEYNDKGCKEFDLNGFSWS